jgi:hypothetical protein
MSPFEYVIVLISIILGLGITTILTGLAEMIKHSRLSRIYAPHAIWIVLVFVLHVHEWWENYSLKSISVWKLPMFLFILLYPINLYVLAHLLFPSEIKSGVSSKEFYLSNFRRLFISAIILDVLSVIHNLTFLNLTVVDQLPHAIVLAILFGGILSKSKNTATHTAIALLLLITLITVILLTQDVFLVG